MQKHWRTPQTGLRRYLRQAKSLHLSAPPASPPVPHSDNLNETALKKWRAPACGCSIFPHQTRALSDSEGLFFLHPTDDV